VRPTARSLAGGAALGAASRVSVAVTGALTTVAIARLLGPAGSGGFAIALSLVLILTVLTTLGVEQGVVYFVSGRAWSPRAAFRAVLGVAATLGVLGAVGGFAVRLAVPSAFGGISVAGTAVVVAALPFALAWYFVSFAALAIDDYEGYVLPPAAQSALALALAGGLAAPFGLTGALAGLTASHALTGAGTALWAARRLPDLPPEPGREPAGLRSATSFGMKTYASNVLQMLNYRLDLFILSGIAGRIAVGHYAVAVAVTSVLWLLPRALADVLFPRVAALSASEEPSDHDQRALVETKTLRHTVAIAAVASAALAIALVLLVVPVYGPDFRASVDLGLILLPGVALVALTGTLSATIVGRGRPGYVLAVTAFVTPLTVALYAVLIPALGAKGAALASSISYAASFVLTAVYYRRLTGEGLLARLVPTRSELDDYRTLAPALAARLGVARRGRGRAA
jgi:O-antigen/teichoic acid export membrane protein